MSVTAVSTVLLTVLAATPAATDVTSITLSEPVASFGAAVLDGQLYIYGGHRGEAHAHSRDNLAPAFRRIDLNHPVQWQSLTMETPLQGLALVSDGKYLYRVGGMTAHNAAGEAEDLHSTDVVRRYDPATGAWSDMPALPEPRSSHDAIVHDGKLYVIGGWILAGEGHGQWHDTAWVLDLNDEKAEWQALPAPPFKNRALAVAAVGGKIYALGGMTSDGEISRKTYALDPQTGNWSELASLPGAGMQGFGVSAWGHASGLYAAGTDGALYRLGNDGSSWEAVDRLDHSRFFHRLLPLDATSLIAVGGASHEVGHLDDVERLSVTR
ncbi:MAG: DUF1668 domain-containing protein [Pirellulales bacterium]